MKYRYWSKDNLITNLMTKCVILLLITIIVIIIIITYKLYYKKIPKHFFFFVKMSKYYTLTLNAPVV